ncbi:MAG: DoxX family protein [Actinomycetota bacterium]
MRMAFPHVRRGSDLAALFLRLALGPILAYHGYRKIGDVSGFAAFIDSLPGVPFPTLTAYAVTFLELVGGLAILIGLLTPVWAFLLAIQFALIPWLVKLDVGLIAPPGQGPGAELDLLILAMAIALILIGPGAFSLDAALRLTRAPADLRSAA